jgi:hypothetical protein
MQIESGFCPQKEIEVKTAIYQEENQQEKGHI